MKITIFMMRYVYSSLLILIFIVECKKPRSKRQQDIWRVECQLGIVTDTDCPADGAWGTWGPWSECYGTCDKIGSRHRTRECNNPPPQNNGFPCDGLHEQTEACYLTNCSVEDFREIVQGDEARMEAFNNLKAVPALMERCLQVDCSYEAIEASLASENTWQLDAESLWNSLQCVKHNLGCPLIGAWGPWGIWFPCGARCGPGFRWRLRRCNFPAPSAAEFICNGAPLQTEMCVGDQCALEKYERKRSSTWGPWGPWSSCSERCGSGVRRRRRTCKSFHKTYSSSGLWKTNCRGQHDQIEICENKKCILDGNWSGWGTWSSCSQTCGAGRRTRSRSCTRPIPAGGGTPCAGMKSEMGSCHLKPCKVFMHTVAIFNGQGFIHYNFVKKRSKFFHFYIRFLPLFPHGTLVRRGKISAPLIRLSLQNWRVCVETNGKASNPCQIRLCSNNGVESAVWHSILFTVTTEEVKIRINDATVPVTGTFPCDPEFPDETMSIYIGEMFHGEIQEAILNFIPLKLKNNHRNKRTQMDFYPHTTANISYEQASMDEAMLRFDADQYLRLPCFKNQDEWCIELTLKPNKESGTIVFLNNYQKGDSLMMALQSMRLVLKVSMGSNRLETISSTEYYPDQWLDIKLLKNRDSKTVEAIINSKERLHLVMDSNEFRRNVNNWKNTTINKETSNLSLIVFCDNQLFIGGIPCGLTNELAKSALSLSCLLASLIINNVLQDLHANNLERMNNQKIQISSRTASISGAYYELTWGKSKKINLTCVHNFKPLLPSSYAEWFYLDIAIHDAIKNKTVIINDNGRALRLAAIADNDLRGFYTCRTHSQRNVRNFVTYGVIGETKPSLTEPGKITMLTVVTTLGLIIFTLSWLCFEGINDLRNGYGFYRDHHLTPEEEAEAVCTYIDNNLDLIGSKSLARLAKARARRKGRQLAASYPNFGAQEPQGIMQVNKCVLTSTDNSLTSESENVLALPTINSSSAELTHELYKRDVPLYVSSPVSGLDKAENGNVASSAITKPSPQQMCAQFLMSKNLEWSFTSAFSSKENYLKLNVSKRQRSDYKTSRNPIKPKRLLTIESSSINQDSPAVKVLKKFSNLKNYDG